MKLSTVIIVKNEEKNILDCIESISDSDEILVIDDYSTDRTKDVIKSLNNEKIKLIEHKLDNDFAGQRNYALDHTSGDYILFLDADERASKELFSEIRQKIEGDIDGFYIKRADIMWGKRLKHGETGGIKFLRLARKGSGKWSGKVHETWSVKGSVETLQNALLHYPHQSVFEFLREVDFYSTLRAQELYDAHKKATLFEIIFYPKAKLFVNYFLKLGFLDGMPGFIVAVMMSLHSFLVRSKLWLLNQK